MSSRSSKDAGKKITTITEIKDVDNNDITPFSILLPCQKLCRCICHDLTFFEVLHIPVINLSFCHIGELRQPHHNLFLINIRFSGSVFKSFFIKNIRWLIPVLCNSLPVDVQDLSYTGFLKAFSFECLNFSVFLSSPPNVIIHIHRCYLYDCWNPLPKLLVFNCRRGLVLFYRLQLAVEHRISAVYGCHMKFEYYPIKKLVVRLSKTC